MTQAFQLSKYGKKTGISRIDTCKSIVGAGVACLEAVNFITVHLQLKCVTSTGHDFSSTLVKWKYNSQDGKAQPDIQGIITLRVRQEKPSKNIKIFNTNFYRSINLSKGPHTLLLREPEC